MLSLNGGSAVSKLISGNRSSSVSNVILASIGELDMRLQGKTGIVTGGARGIGGAIAQCLVAEGARVAVLDLDHSAAREHAARLGSGNLAFASDAADESSVKQAVDRAAAELGGLDIMVNNAGAARGDEVASEFQPVPPFTNLDHAASTPAFAPVWDTARRALRLPEAAGPALAAEVRAIIARTLHASLADYEIIFTSNTTEAINLVAAALGSRDGGKARPVVLNSLLEHN